MAKKTGSILPSHLDQLIPWLVLAIILLFTYVKFFQQTYTGFRWDTSGQIVFIFTNGDNANPLQIGDHLLQADSLTWTDFKRNLSQPFIRKAAAGDMIHLTVERNNQQLTIPWTIPGPNWGEISDRIWNEGLLSLVFWFMGTVALLNIRPKNAYWLLLIAFNYLTAIWLVLGGLTINHIWASPIIMRVFVWLSLPVYLHLHWIFPKPLARLSARIIWGGYLLTGVLVVAQIFQWIPSNLYYLAFLISILVCIVLLVLHAVKQPEARRELRALLLIAMLSFLPPIIAGLLRIFLRPYVDLPVGLDGLGLLTLPLLPMAYLYAAMRRHLAGLEARFNQVLSAYIFLTMLMIVLLPLIILMSQWITGWGSGILIGLLVLVVATSLTLLSYGYIQDFVERSILGVSLPSQSLLELYSGHITSSTTFSDLNRILESEILPRLHVREFVFVQIKKESAKVQCSLGIDTKGLQLPPMLLFPMQAGIYRPVEATPPGGMFAWIRLLIELKIEGELIGLWLFGRCDPDDYYSEKGIALIQSLANQTAVAMSNILQTQRVLELYHQDISRDEDERMRLALELHDSILNLLASLYLSLDDTSVSPRFQMAYDELTGQLRGIISNLRPPMLSFGLNPAFEELIESLNEHEKETEFILDLPSSECRYSPEVEQHLFRIVQEAIANALRHGRAKQIKLKGDLSPEEIHLVIIDNGDGFEATKGFELAGLLANKHFGLAGMLERARMIGGDLKIVSQPEMGTQIDFKWPA